MVWVLRCVGLEFNYMILYGGPSLQASSVGRGGLQYNNEDSLEYVLQAWLYWQHVIVPYFTGGPTSHTIFPDLGGALFHWGSHQSACVGKAS